MSDAAIAVLTASDARFHVDELKLDQFSGEICKLLLMAISCVDDNESLAIDHVRRASHLLQPLSVLGHTHDRAGCRSAAGARLLPWQVRRIKSYVTDRIAGQISLNDLAQLVSLSSSYFCAAFRASFGMSPHSYVLAQRVEFAKQRMLLSDTPLCEIALDCGLADQAHLSRVFRRLTGMTPSSWRRYSLRKKKPELYVVAGGVRQ
jgi:AraC family transcriptional regulator